MSRSMLLSILLALSAVMATQAHARYFPYDPEGSQGTFPVALNASRTSTGYFVDEDSVVHGFVRHRSGRIAVFDPFHSVIQGRLR